MKLLFLSVLASICLCAAASAEPVSIFDGKTLEGWDFDPQIWRVEDGMITGGSTTEKIKENHFICTKKNYKNFDLKLKIKVSGDPATGLLNSGIQIRSVRVPGGAHMCGYQVDCGKGWFGKIYDEFRRNKVIAEPVDAAALDKAVEVYGWNEYHIRAEGARIQAWINGVLTLDYTEQDPNIPLDGLIGPQVHSGGICLVQLKDVTIEELPSTKDAPTWESLGGYEGAKAKLAKPAAPTAAVTTKKDVSYNDVTGIPRTAEEEQKLFHLPEGYEIELVVKESEGLGKFVSVYFDQRGRMWTQTALEYPLDANENPAAAEAVYAAKSKDKVLVYPREAINAPLPPGGLTNPTVFADGLAIPLGLLPWGNGDSAYILHGHDIMLFTDTDGDGKSDKSETLLTGFGVQDSHLFPHQFTRAPGGWIWMAQGAFNSGKVQDKGGKVTDFPSTRMARFRPDGTNFEITSQGPCNIWGLVMTGEGETFIQEANDFGYPVMPFHEYANYPGCADRLFKSYAPHFPVQAPDFKMGGTGLSGLALGEHEFRKLTPTAKEDDLCMFVANPITSKIQTLAMHREDSRKFPREAPNGWRLEQAKDLLTCDDPFFRPVGMTNGPDGCIYIVDWYNKIISHNEVARNHPDRDKIRGRIWRVKPKNDAARHSNVEIPDFTKLSTDALIAKLGTVPTAQAHLAWQTLADRKASDADTKLHTIIAKESATDSAKIQSTWALTDLGSLHADDLAKIDTSSNRNVRRETSRVRGTTLKATGSMLQAMQAGHDESDPEARAEAIRLAGSVFNVAVSDTWGDERFPMNATYAFLSFVKPSLPGPTAPSRAGKAIPVGEAYDREFERYLVRMFLEQHPEAVAKFLDTEEAATLPIEARVLASLALEPKTSASRVAKLLPQLDRAPNEEELFRLAQFPEEAGCGEALKALLSKADTRASVAEKLLTQKTKLDPTKIAPLLNEAAKALLTGKDDERALAVSLIGGFQLASLETDLIAMVKQNTHVLPALQALRELRSDASDVFVELAKSTDPIIRDEALAALASSKSPTAADQLFTLYPTLSAAQRRSALNALSSTKPGAKAIVAALANSMLPKIDLDGPTAERLSIVLGDDAELAKVMQTLGHVFHNALLLDGSDTAVANSKITLEGAFTVECWVRLAPGIDNADSLLGTPGGIDLNFFGSTLRVYGGGELRDVVVAKKPMTPDLWTHIAVTRDAQGICRIYQNGELDATGTKPASVKWENCQIGLSGPKKGTEGMITEFRVWNRERTAIEIRANFDRVIDSTEGMKRFDDAWGKLGQGARIAKTTDYPPILTKEQAEALDTKFAKYTALGHKPGNLENGKALSAICMACHTIGSNGGQIGPNLSGAGAMGLEGVLRNIMTPNAAMEAGYRIFRVEMKSGDIVDAFYVSDDKEAFVVRQPGMQDRRIPKPEVRSTQYIRRSLMPEGLLDALNEQQVTDLMSYLMTLK
ncbi:hypothetical protein BH11VER1_BH11VER1_14980 [soil metagenome]